MLLLWVRERERREREGERENKRQRKRERERRQKKRGGVVGERESDTHAGKDSSDLKIYDPCMKMQTCENANMRKCENINTQKRENVKHLYTCIYMCLCGFSEIKTTGISRFTTLHKRRGEKCAGVKHVYIWACVNCIR